MTKQCAVLALACILLITPTIAVDLDWSKQTLSWMGVTVVNYDAAYNSSDILHIVYSETSSTHKYMTFDPLTNETSGPIDLGIGTYDKGPIKVLFDDADTLHMIYMETNVFPTHYLKYIKKPNGGSWSSPITISETAYASSTRRYGDVTDLAVSPNGSLVWVTYYDYNYNPYLAQLTGGTFTSYPLYGNVASYTSSSSVTLNDDGIPYFFYYYSRSEATIAYRSGTGEVVYITNNTGMYKPYYHARLRFDSTGDLHLGWIRPNESNYYTPVYTYLDNAVLPVDERVLTGDDDVYSDVSSLGLGVDAFQNVYIAGIANYPFVFVKLSEESEFSDESLDPLVYNSYSRVIFNSTQTPTLLFLDDDGTIVLFLGETPNPPPITPTPTPTPSSTSPSTYGGRPDVPFPQPTYSGVEVISCTPHPDNRVTLVGRVTNTTTDPTGWFILGTDSDTYAYHTVMLDTDDEGFFVEDVSGLPLTPGDTFYVRAVTESGRSPFEISFTMEGLPTVLPTTFGHYWQMIDRSNKSLPVFVGVIPRVFVDYFGEDSTLGWQVFYLMIFGVGFLVMFGRQRNVIIPMLVFMIAGYFIIQLIPSEMQALAYGLTIVCAMGVIFYIVRKGD